MSTNDKFYFIKYQLVFNVSMHAQLHNHYDNNDMHPHTIVFDLCVHRQTMRYTTYGKNDSRYEPCSMTWQSKLINPLPPV